MPTIYHIPRAFMKEPDPREQDMVPYALPSPGVTDPIVASAMEKKPYLMALRGELPAAHCAGCGMPLAYHYDTTGLYQLDCHGAWARKRLGLKNQPTTSVWGDTHPMVSQMLRDALHAACGPTVSMFWESLTPEDQTNLSRRLAELSVLALRQADANRAGEV